ncbi:Small nuclear ribonucleoprotein family protein [Hibiscus syriacus]|uniref:Small nuclear ribonucleoprotein family protein n=1 Tax=Hibiscus syriacus TaxID=106335 RepID=A0A6A3AHD7_HIBSY|nr:Small nuclear ribonucleoprotein family protein [Hibiscus syriacus]
MCKMARVKRRENVDLDAQAFHKELDEVSCPICMEHPHNAVLLLCSSHEKEGEGIVDTGESFRRRVEFEEVDAGNTSISSLKCPFCGGKILGWEVVEEGRRHLNLKKRTCSKESCSYSGNYGELRRHARRHQRGYDDTVSAIRSAMPGAVVVGDYVIEDGDRLAGERENGTEQGPEYVQGIDTPEELYLNVGNDAFPVPRRRRRLMQPRSDEDQS